MAYKERFETGDDIVNKKKFLGFVFDLPRSRHKNLRPVERHLFSLR